MIALGDGPSVGGSSLLSRRYETTGRVLAGLLLSGSLVFPFVGGYPLAYAMMIVSLLLVVWWLANAPRPGELREPAGVMAIAAVVLLLTAMAITATGIEDLAYAGNFTMLAVFLLLRPALRRLAWDTAAGWVGLGALAGSILAALVAAAQVLALGYARARGFGSDPIWAAQAALLLGFMALVGLWTLDSKWRPALFLGPLAGLTATVLTGSHGPLLAVVPLALVAMFVIGGRYLRVAAVLAACLVVVVAASASLWALSSGWGGQAMLFSTLDKSLQTRLTLYQGSVRAFAEAPLAGHGWSARLAAVYDQVPGGEAAIVAADSFMYDNRHLHSDILDFAVGTGLIGVLAYGLIIAAPLVGALFSPQDRQRRARLLGTSLLSTAYVSCALSYVMLGYEFPTTQYVILAAIILALCRDRPIQMPGLPGPVRRDS